MDGFDRIDPIHSYGSPKDTSPFVRLDNDLIRKGNKLDFYPESPSFN